MNPTNIAVTQYVRFKSREAACERFQIEIGDTYIDDLSREDIETLRTSIETALTLGSSAYTYQKQQRQANNVNQSESSSDEQSNNQIEEVLS